MLLEWLGALDDDARRLALRLGLVAAIVAGGAGLWHARPAWRLDSWRDLAAVVGQVADRAAVPEPTPAPPVEPTPAPPVCIASEVQTIARLKLRAEPGLRGRVLRVLAQGERLPRLDCDAVEADGVTWRRVAREDGASGWSAATGLREGER